MDDDDWYGPDYILDMSMLLLQSDAYFAGSGDDYYFDVTAQRVLFVPAVRENTSCNGVLCYKSFVLQSRRYDSDAKSGEEPSFNSTRQGPATSGYQAHSSCNGL